MTIFGVLWHSLGNPTHNPIWMTTAGMILAICPILASDGVLGGLRGEFRRIEDKFVDHGMEMKLVQIPFDLTNLHGNRTGLVSALVIWWLGISLIIYRLNIDISVIFVWTPGPFQHAYRDGWSFWTPRWEQSKRCSKLPEVAKDHWQTATAFARMTSGAPSFANPPSHCSPATHLHS